MAYSPWNRRPPVLPERTRTFELVSGESLTITLRKLGTVEQTEVFELAQRLTERYVTGDEEFVESKGASGVGPVPFPPLAGEFITPTTSMIQSAAFAQIMQQGDPATWMDADTWIAFQAVEDAADWFAIQKFIREVNTLGKAEDPRAADIPNGSGADMRDSSNSPSLRLANTPKSPSEETPSSAVSMIG
jgi:hypothetical protein